MKDDDKKDEKKYTANKAIFVMMDDRELSFDVPLSEYNHCINNMQPGNKIQPSYNLLFRCAVNDETRDAVKYCSQNGLVLDLFAEVLSGYRPQVEFAVKK